MDFRREIAPSKLKLFLFGASLCILLYFLFVWIVTTILYMYYVPAKRKIRKIKKLKDEDEQLPPNFYDVIIVGGGPAGGCCAYYTAKEGLNVAVLERKKFPRDKFCGNAICVPAIRILKEMGILQDFVDANEVAFADAGGFVSPTGNSYLGTSVVKVGEPLSGAIKRIILDDKIIKNSRKAGAHLFEDVEVENASFNTHNKTWKVVATSGEEFSCRVLVSCDGSQSNLARKLGYVSEAPKGISSRCYIEGGTHNAKMDGLVVYPPFSLPGYCAVFRHPNDELNFCFYLIPCGKGDKLGNVTAADLPSLHKYALEEDYFISSLIGPNAKIEPIRVAPLRVGLQGVKSTYGDNLLICGDAAGFVDPLTGEGIHNAMMSGRDAALTLIEMKKANNYSQAACAQYEDRWFNSFGYDFKLSSDFSWLIWKCPFVLDACCEEMHRVGDTMFAEWAKVMTMLSSKEVFFEFRTASALGFAIIAHLFKQYFLGSIFHSLRSHYPSKWNSEK